MWFHFWGKALSSYRLWIDPCLAVVSVVLIQRIHTLCVWLAIWFLLWLVLNHFISQLTFLQHLLVVGCEVLVLLQLLHFIALWYVFFELAASFASYLLLPQYIEVLRHNCLQSLNLLATRCSLSFLWFLLLTSAVAWYHCYMWSLLWGLFFPVHCNSIAVTLLKSRLLFPSASLISQSNWFSIRE